MCRCSSTATSQTQGDQRRRHDLPERGRRRRRGQRARRRWIERDAGRRSERQRRRRRARGAQHRRRDDRRAALAWRVPAVDRRRRQRGVHRCGGDHCHAVGGQQRRRRRHHLHAERHHRHARRSMPTACSRRAWAAAAASSMAPSRAAPAAPAARAPSISISTATSPRSASLHGACSRRARAPTASAATSPRALGGQAARRRRRTAWPCTSTAARRTASPTTARCARCSGPPGFAFRGGAGGDFVDNHGAVMGNVDLGAGANGFANNVDGTFYSGTTLNLGDRHQRAAQRRRDLAGRAAARGEHAARRQLPAVGHRYVEHGDRLRARATRSPHRHGHRECRRRVNLSLLNTHAHPCRASPSSRCSMAPRR